MAKAKARPIQQARPAARHVDPDRTTRMLVVGGVVALIVLALGVIGYGWYQTQIKPLGKTVLQVGETKFSLGHVERRMRLELDLNSGYQGQALLQLPDNIVAQLEDEGRLLEGVAELNLTVTEAELATDIRERGGLAEDVEAGVFADEFRRQVEESHLHEGEYRQMLTANLLGNKARSYFTYLAPSAEPQVLFRWIVVDNQDSAEDVLRRLDAGEDFTTVGQEVSLDPTRAEKKTANEDWSPKGFFPSVSVEKYLFEDGQVGQRSDIIAVGDFSYIVELVDRDDDHQLGDTQRARVGERELAAWLERVNVQVTKDFTIEDASRALNDVLPN